ncbi:MAG: hypothetical protein M3N59_01650 [bacterium]|nr:hypothetical protein [bacterium]
MRRTSALCWLLSAALAVSLVALPARASAQATVTVSGTVCHPDPDTPVITAPANGATVGTNIITVSGTATPNETIQLLRNNLDAGSAAVNGSGQWSLPVTLASGANTLVAKGCFTSSPVTVTYKPAPGPAPRPAPRPQPGSPGQVPGGPVPVFPNPVGPGEAVPVREPVQDLLLSVSGSSSRSIRAGEEARFQLAIYGGRGAYRVRVDWGDGAIEELTVGRNGRVTLVHRYDEAGRFAPVVTVTDADGRRGMMWFAVDVRAATPGPSPSPAPQGGGSVEWWELLPLVAAFLLLLAMVYRRRRHTDDQEPDQHDAPA